MAEYKAILEKGRQNNRKRSEKMRKLRMSDPEYRAKMEEKERLALEREKKRQERATKKKKIALAELKEQAEKGNQEAVRELEERRAIARERSRKSAEKRKQRAENDPEYAAQLVPVCGDQVLFFLAATHIDGDIVGICDDQRAAALEAGDVVDLGIGQLQDALHALCFLFLQVQNDFDFAVVQDAAAVFSIFQGKEVVQILRGNQYTTAVAANRLDGLELNM